MESNAEYALISAAREGDLAELKELIQARADLEAVSDDPDEWTALHWASFAGQLESVKLLIEAGADLNARSKSGSTPLCQARSVKITKELIQAGADLEVKNNWGYTALHHASRCGYLEIVEVLIQAGADPFVVDNDGDTPLDVARNDETKDSIRKAIDGRMKGTQHGDIV